MRTPNGRCASIPLADNGTKDDTLHVSKEIRALLPSQIGFIDLIMFHGVTELSRSLKLVHDLALYHSDVCFDNEEKMALYNLKTLWEGLEEIEEES